MNSFSNSYATDALQKQLLIARIQLADLETPSASIVRLDEVSSTEQIHPVTFLNLPQGYGISTEGLSQDSLASRMLRLMEIEQWRGEQIPADLQSDHEACLTLMLMLSKHHGYASVAAGIDEHFDKTKLDKLGSSWKDVLSLADVQESLDKLFDTLVEGGWRGGNAYLLRPASEAVDEAKPFEMVVHPAVMGWKLPALLVDACLESARQRADRARHSHTERQVA